MVIDRSEVLPVKIDSASNGEYPPIPVGPDMRRAKAVAAARIDDNARRSGQTRRRFLGSLCAVATTLAAFNQAFAYRGNLRGGFRLAPDSDLDPVAARETLSGDEFIFDVQTHAVDPNGAWRSSNLWDELRRRFPNPTESWLSNLPQGECGEWDPVDCFGADYFVKEIFLDSDTDMAVLSFFPTPPDKNPLPLNEADRIRGLADAMDGTPRLLLHAVVMPNLPPLEAQLENMEQAAADYRVSAWKVYTHWAPDGGPGWRLDDPEVGIPFIEKARTLGVPTICIHKGISGRRIAADYASCLDVGRAARLFPDVNFLIYHSGFQFFRREGPYRESDATVGVDSLVKSLADNGIPPGANVYAELGSTWRRLMQDPTGAAHVLGKLFTSVGADRILWRTDCIWYGSPQDQIQAFRSFSISEVLQERHGYPALTPEIREKIFGLNGARVYGLQPELIRQRASRDGIGRIKADYRETPDPSHLTYGPKTAAEYRALLRERRGFPA